MRKRGFITLALAAVMVLALSVSAGAQNGPFWTLDEAVGGRNLVANPDFVAGGEIFWGDEGPFNLFDGQYATKYGAGEDGWPFWASWRYAEAFVADRFLFQTANDNESNPRRMGDGWTFSGSNDATNWTVLHAGRHDEYENYNFAWFFVDLPNNAGAYRYYRLLADFGADSGGIQLAQVAVTGSPPGAAAPAVGGAPATAPVIPVAAEDVPQSAPSTADPITLIAIGALCSAAGVLFAKRRK